MKGERKLRLVVSHDGGGSKPAPNPPDLDRDDEPPFTDEEIAAAAELREAIAGRAEPLALELQAAYAPGTLGEADLDAIVDRALGREAASTSAERAAAEQLRVDLDRGLPPPLAQALRVALRPTELDPARNEALIAGALRAPLRKSPLRRIAPATMAALTGLAALAASVALFLGRPPAPRPAATAELVRARSADDLFDATTPFPRHGEESARIDRIASARAADLRRNRFAAWGVK